jgi:hypothetical protein
MYMMIRKKCKDITDARLLEFLNSHEHRQALLKGFGLEFHEQEQVLGVGFHIRDRMKALINLDDDTVTEDKATSFVLKMHELAFPESSIEDKNGKIWEWLEKDKHMSKVCLATGIYFLNHYERGVVAETTYRY